MLIWLFYGKSLNQVNRNIILNHHHLTVHCIILVNCWWRWFNLLVPIVSFGEKNIWINCNISRIWNKAVLGLLSSTKSRLWWMSFSINHIVGNNIDYNGISGDCVTWVRTIVVLAIMVVNIFIVTYLWWFPDWNP